MQVKQTDEKNPCVFDYFQAVDTEWNSSVLYLEICSDLLNLMENNQLLLLHRTLPRWIPFCRWLLSSPYAGQRTEFKLPTQRRIESSSKTIFLEVHWPNYNFSLWLWKEILAFDSNKPDPQISRSVGWTRRFVSAVAAALQNKTTSYHIELKDLRTLPKHKLAGTVKEIKKCVGFDLRKWHHQVFLEVSCNLLSIKRWYPGRRNMAN